MKKSTIMTAAGILLGFATAMAGIKDAGPKGMEIAAPVEEALDSELLALSDSALIMKRNSLDELQRHKKLPEIRFTTIGVTVGGGVANYRSDPKNDLTVPCVRAGLNFDIPFGQFFSLQPEWLFAMRGGGFESNGQSFKEHLYYMDVPVNCKFSTRLNMSKKATGRPFVSLGPVFSLGLMADGDVEGKSYKPFQNDPGNEISHAFYTNFDLSLNMRLGYDFDRGYSVAVGYQMGLTDLFADNLTQDEEKYYHKIYGREFPSVHNNSFYISVGYCW